MRLVEDGRPRVAAGQRLEGALPESSRPGSQRFKASRQHVDVAVLLGVQLLANERQDVVRIGIAADHLLLEDELAVEMHVEDPVRSRHDLDRADLIRFPLLEQLRRQTGGVRKRSSGNAVLDADVVSRGHRVIVSDL
jgi:hypothetical protein